MIVTTFTAASTLLFIREEVMLEGKGCHSLHSREQFVQAGHKCNGAEITCV